MSEVTRLLDKYELTDRWIAEEIRCEFTVEPWRKKLWLVMLDLGIELMKTCRAHGLTCYLVGGSLLGAVRHRGFIPWDDDMDFGMPRADYEILTAHPEWFEAPYFLQTHRTDPGYLYSYAKLRNSRTAAVTPLFAWQKMNQGMMVDIFPMDAWVPGEGRPVYDAVMALNRDNSAYMRRSNPCLSAADRARAESWSGRDPHENIEEVERLARSFEGRKTYFLSHAVITVDAYDCNYFPRADLAVCTWTDFEGFPLPIPAGYDDFLTREYGDYRKFPPVEKRGAAHSEFLFDAERPYTAVLAELGVDAK